MSDTPVPDTLVYTSANGATVTLPTQEAMARYAQEGFTGKLTPVAAPAVPAAPVAQSVNDAGGDAARERNARHMAALDALGFAVADPFFAVGQPLIQSGKDKRRAMATDHAKKPLIEDAASDVAARIEAERRTDFVVPLRDLTITPEGQISRGKGSIPLEPLAWESLVTAAAPVLPSARALLRVLDPDIRADVWNRQRVKLPETAVAKIGVRKDAEGGWRAFRALSGTYPTEAQADRVLRAVASAVKGEGMRGSVTYDPATTRVRFEGAWMMPHEVDARVGDFLRAGFGGSTADASNGGFRVSLAVTRILCVNLTLADAYIAAYRRSHRGNLSTVTDEIAATIRAVPEGFAAFAEDWKIARNTGVKGVTLFGKSYNDAREALTGLVEAGQITQGIARDTLVEALLAAHDKEPGDSLADVLNAVTRAAHEAEWSEFHRQLLEQRAGELLPVLAQAAA